MGLDAGGRKPAHPAGRTIVAFDFDGTLTARDSFMDFLRTRTPARRWPLGALRLIPALTHYGLRSDRGALKAALVRILLADLTPSDMTAEAEQFCNGRFAALIRPDALRCWNDHARAGDVRVIVTASPELLVQPFARRLGADRLLGTRLATDARGHVCGLQGENCRGPEKVRRLTEAFGPDLELAAAYGDSAGDREMLARSRQPSLKVFRERPRPQVFTTSASASSRFS